MKDDNAILLQGFVRRFLKGLHAAHPICGDVFGGNDEHFTWILNKPCGVTQPKVFK